MAWVITPDNRLTAREAEGSKHSRNLANPETSEDREDALVVENYGLSPRGLMVVGLEDKVAARLQDAPHLRRCLFKVVNVVDGVSRQYDVEELIAKGNML